MKVIGITGGIGSGKSLVARIMQGKYGARYIDTDQIAREQMEPGGASYDGVVQYFGREILLEDGRIDRTKLAQIVFEQKDKLQKLNELTHPQVLIAVNNEIEKAKAEGNVPYVLIETALMIEAGYDYICDQVWYVHAPEEERRNRLKKHRNYTDEKINSVFESQRKDQAFRQRYPKVIENVKGVKFLEEQIERLLDNL